MTARQLIKLLEKCPPDQEVYLEVYSQSAVTGITLTEDGVLLGEEYSRANQPEFLDVSQ
jgi:hypothetical protein